MVLARGRYLSGTVPFAFVIGKSGELKPIAEEQATISEIPTLQTMGKSLGVIAAAMTGKSLPMLHNRVRDVLARPI